MIVLEPSMRFAKAHHAAVAVLFKHRHRRVTFFGKVLGERVWERGTFP